GSLTVAGRDTRAASLADLASTVGVLFQDPETQLVMLDTDDEIAFGLENLEVPREAMRERIAEARAAAGLGPDTPRRLDALSGGAKQRVALASLLERWPRAMRPARERSAPGRVVLGAREVAYRYRGADRDAIAGISLEFRRGEIAAIVGANGAGKSTLGLVLGRALRPSRGAVSGDARVAYVFQYPERGFLANTVREEMTYAARAG